MKYNGTVYYFVTNLQGDVMMILNADGSLAGGYVYDPYGKVLSATGTIANINPLRYRGYYYDTETGFYYLQSRYYDPEIGRFISADGYASTGQGIIGCNMFAYCGNNPVMFKDASGCRYIDSTSTSNEDPDLRTEACEFQRKVSLEKAALKKEVGGADRYVPVPGSDTGDSPNCYSYALNLPNAVNPGMISGVIPESYGDVEVVAGAVVADMQAMGRSIRRVSGPNSTVNSNEYKVALRVGTSPINVRVGWRVHSVYDYHFMKQTSTGQWAEKHGTGGDSILWDTGMTPDSIPWTLDDTPYYDSEIIYFAVGK